MKWMSVVCLTAVLGVPEIGAAESKLVLFVASDSQDPGLRDVARINVNRIKRAFVKNVASERLKIVSYAPKPQAESKLSDAPAEKTPNLIEAIQRVDLDADDSLVVFVSCRGREDVKSQTVLSFSGAESKVITRAQLVAAVTGRKVKLAALITDATTDFTKVPATRAISGTALMPPLVRTSELFDQLFFESSGFLDLASAKPGQTSVNFDNTRPGTEADPSFGEPLIQFSMMQPSTFGRSDLMFVTSNVQFQWANKRLSIPYRGGIFTESFATILEQQKERKWSWSRVVKFVEDETSSQFDQHYPDRRIVVNGVSQRQATQTVTARSIPK